MINLSTRVPSTLLAFTNKFKPLFSKKQFASFSFYFSGLFLELKRTNIQTIVEKTPLASYENIQYFISESNWDCQKINEQRVALLQSRPTTKTTKKGILVIDDSGCKKWGFQTEGSQVQHYGTEDIVTNCNIVVTSAYCDPKKRFPINLKPYIPKNDPFFKKTSQIFKNKLELAEELIDDALAKKIDFSDILIDNWYFSNDLVESIQEKQLTFISESEVSRLISYRGKWTRADELVKLIPSDKLRWVTVSTPHGKKRGFYTYGFKSKLRDLNGNFLIVLAIGKWGKDDTKDAHVYVTNHLAYSGENVLKKYALRWGIECIFRDLKENVAFDHYQVRTIRAIERHWHLSVLAYTFLLWADLNAYFSKSFGQRAKTMGDCLTQYRHLSSLVSYQWLQENPQGYQKYLGITSHLSLFT